MAYTRKSGSTPNTTFQGRHRFEHWYRDNQIYFITARCRERYPAFQAPIAKSIFWDRFTHYSDQHGFKPIISSLLNNHYHTLGYLRVGRELGEMMRKLHGSVAKRVNDLLPHRRTPFWHDRRHHDYFDGCIRDEKQFRLTYRYIQRQARRSGLPELSVDVRMAVPLERSLARAVEKRALLWGVPYRRYDRDQGKADEAGATR